MSTQAKKLTRYDAPDSVKIVLFEIHRDRQALYPVFLTIAKFVKPKFPFSS